MFSVNLFIIRNEAEIYAPSCQVISNALKVLPCQEIVSPKCYFSYVI